MGLASRRAVYFTMDAAFALTLIAFAIIFASQLSVYSTDRTSSTLLAQDVLLSLESMTLAELSAHQPVVSDILADTALTGNDTVLYGVGFLWVTNDTRLDNLTEVLANVTPVQTGLRLRIQDEIVYEREGLSRNLSASAALQQITGIDEGKPLGGTSSTAFLRRLSNKQNSVFAYFGGLIGQGNVSILIELPADVNSSRINSFSLEGDPEIDYDLLVNEAFCDSFSPSTPSLVPDFLDLDACIPLLQPGTNNISLHFVNITDGYIAGGAVRIDFTTDTFTSNIDLNRTRYVFPEVVGVANVFDAFTVPQTLLSMEGRLHYESPGGGVVSYLTVGEKTVWESNQSGEVDVLLSDADFLAAGLDYSLLSNRTVPVRFASFNTTSTVLTGGNADVVVVTDYSGSMKKDIDSWAQGNAGSVDDCPNLYMDNDIRRTHLGRCLGKEVVDIVMNYSGNRLWPVHYESDDVVRYENPEDQEALMSYYETFSGTWPQQGKGKTCIACALSEAYEVFDENPDLNRSRHVILMTDGLPTHCTDAGCSGRSSGYGSKICEGLCDVSGQNCNSFGSMCTDSSCGSAIGNAMVVAQDLVDDWNVTFHTVAFGPVGTCDNATQLLMDIASLSPNGTFSYSDDPEELRDIYENISTSILQSVELVAQTVVSDSELTLSTLHGDSYIEALHEQTTTPAKQNEIEVTRQTPQLSGCTDTVNFPSGVRIAEARLVSYSGPYWTDLVVANDEQVLNLSEFFVSYSRLGDPFQVNIPISYLSNSTEFTVNIGESPTNSSGCSLNNSVVYTALVPSATSRTPVLPTAEGCVWTIEFEDESNSTAPIPSDYSGPNTCSYTSSSISYNPDDALQVAVYQLLEELDFDEDGRLFISLGEEDLEIITTEVEAVPYLWGPIVVRAEVTQ